MVLSSFHVVVERRRCLSVLNITEPGEVLMGLNSSVPAEASTVELISFLKTAIKEGDIENFHQLCLQLADAFSSAAADAAANGQSDRAWVYDAGSLLHFIVDVISIAPVRGDQEECIQMKMLSSVLQHEPIRFALEYSQNLETPLQHAARLGLTTACRALIERGASVESSMQDGNTALSVAAAYDHIDTMSLLLWSGSHYRLKIQARPKPFIPSFQNQIGSRPASRPSSPGRRYSGNSGNSVSRQSVESSSRSHSVLRTAPLLSPEVTSLLHSSTTPAESAENVQVVAFFLHPSQLVGFGDSDTESDDDTSVVSAKSTAPPEMPQSSADLSTTSIFTDDLEQTIRLANERARGSVTTQDNVSSSLAGEINLSLWQVAGPRAKEFLSKFALSRLSEFDSTSPSNRQSGSFYFDLCLIYLLQLRLGISAVVSRFEFHSSIDSITRTALDP
jgi:hypothetical protein